MGVRLAFRMPNLPSGDDNGKRPADVGECRRPRYGRRRSGLSAWTLLSWFAGGRSARPVAELTWRARDDPLLDRGRRRLPFQPRRIQRNAEMRQRGDGRMHDDRGHHLRQCRHGAPPRTSPAGSEYAGSAGFGRGRNMNCLSCGWPRGRGQRDDGWMEIGPEPGLYRASPLRSQRRANGEGSRSSRRLARSCSSNQRFRSRPPPYPVSEPFDPITR